jgi:hypothetical protein
MSFCSLFSSFCIPLSWRRLASFRRCTKTHPMCVGVVNLYYYDDEGPALCVQSPVHLYYGDDSCLVRWDPETGEECRPYSSDCWAPGW